MASGMPNKLALFSNGALGDAYEACESQPMHVHRLHAMSGDR